MIYLKRLIFFCLCLMPIQQAFAVDLSGMLRYRLNYFKNDQYYVKNVQTPDHFQSSQLSHELKADLIGEHTLMNDTDLVLHLRANHTYGNNDPDDNFTPRDDLKIHQGFFDTGGLFGRNVHLKIGRQELRYGREILVGADDWDNMGRSFDAIKLYSDNTFWDIDTFYASVSDADPLAREDNIHFAGVNIRRSTLFNTINEGYVFYLKSPQWPGNAPNAYYLYNLGTRMEGKLGRPFFYHFMLNYQIGTVYTDGNGGGLDTQLDLRAYSYLIQLDYFINWQAIKNMGIQIISASGDKKRTPNREISEIRDALYIFTFTMPSGYDTNLSCQEAHV